MSVLLSYAFLLLSYSGEAVLAFIVLSCVHALLVR